MIFIVLESMITYVIFVPWLDKPENHSLLAASKPPRLLNSYMWTPGDLTKTQLMQDINFFWPL